MFLEQSTLLEWYTYTGKEPLQDTIIIRTCDLLPVKSRFSVAVHSLCVALLVPTLGSKYAGNLTTLSNYRHIKQMILNRELSTEYVKCVDGMGNSYGIAFTLEAMRTYQVNDILEHLKYYEHLSKDSYEITRQDCINEAWRNWLQKEFLSEIVDRTDKKLSTHASQNVFNLFCKYTQKNPKAIYFEVGCSLIVDFDVLLKDISVDDLREFKLL